MQQRAAPRHREQALVPGFLRKKMRMNTYAQHDARTSISKLAAWTLASEQAYRSELAMRQVKLLVLDTIGCALAGAASDTTERAIAVTSDLGGTPECTIIGAPAKTS